MGLSGWGHIGFISDSLKDREARRGLHASGLIAEAHHLPHEVGTVIPELPTLAIGQSSADIEAHGWITPQSDGKSPQPFWGEKIISLWFKPHDFCLRILIGFELEHQAFL
jgi:hypothetical protein